MQNLAEKLISTKNEAERKKLLSKNPPANNVKLAHALKEICYADWTSKPTRAQKSAVALKSLEKLDSDREIKAVSHWVSGISDLTKGRLESAVENFDLSKEIFFEIKKPHDAAQTQVAKLIALAMLGKYVEAIETGKTALKIFEKYGDQLAAGKIEKNLGNIVARQGDEKQAEQYYLAARKRFVKLGDVSELTMTDNSLANTYAELNDFQKAEKFYAQALKNARTTRMKVTEAEIEASMGNLALFRGRYGDALRLLELSRRKYETLEMPHQQAIAELEIADIYAELNLADEAFEIYAKVSETLKKLKLGGEEARARANFGRVAARLENIRLARKQLKKSAGLYELEKNPNGTVAVKLSKANL
jgi:tetratricopeptide (TPR) repeat protein